MGQAKIRILFVCMGNICRSPAAEAVMQSKVEEAGLSHLIECDSAGTINYHSGQPADQRMRNAASGRGYHMTSRARKIREVDLKTFDHILTMDEDNYNEVIELDIDARYREKIRPFCSYVKAFDVTDIPDPYYGGLDGFDHVLDLLEDGCGNLLENLTRHRL